MTIHQTLPKGNALPAGIGESRPAIARVPQQNQWFDTIPGEKLAIVVHSDEVGGRFSIYESLAAPGTGTPMHYHAEDEIFRVIDGVVTFSVDGQTFDAHPGTVVVVPAGRPHAWCNRQTEPSRTHVVLTPGGLEGLFQQLQGAGPEEIARLASKYGTHVTGPGFAG